MVNRDDDYCYRQLRVLHLGPYFYPSRGNPRTEFVSQFSLQSRRHALFFSRRANLEAVLASGEGRSSPSSSPSPLHHPSMTSPFMSEQFPAVGKGGGRDWMS